MIPHIYFVSAICFQFACISSWYYNDVIMSAMASQITGLVIIYSTIYSRRRSKKTSKLPITGPCARNSPTSEFPHKSPVTQTMFPFDDVIMKHWQSLALKNVLRFEKQESNKSIRVEVLMAWCLHFYCPNFHKSNQFCWNAKLHLHLFIISQHWDGTCSWNISMGLLRPVTPPP